MHRVEVGAGRPFACLLCGSTIHADSIAAYVRQGSVSLQAEGRSKQNGLGTKTAPLRSRFTKVSALCQSLDGASCKCLAAMVMTHLGYLQP